MSPHVIGAIFCFGVFVGGMAIMVADALSDELTVRRARRAQQADVAYVRSVGRQNGWRP